MVWIEEWREELGVRLDDHLEPFQSDDSVN